MSQIATDKKGKVVTVERGDTLSQIAKDYAEYTNKATYQTIAKWNDIANPNLIYVGQKIKLYDAGTSSTTTTSTSAKAVTITHKGRVSDKSNDVFVQWKWGDHGRTEKYEVTWAWKDSDAWFSAYQYEKVYSEYLYATFTIPENANIVRCQVYPVAKTTTKDNKSVPVYAYQKYCDWVDVDKTGRLPATPPAPTIEMGDINESGEQALTASLSNLDDSAVFIVFELAQDNKTYKNSGKQTVTAASASFKWDVPTGHTYKVRCYARSDTNADSVWSPYSSEQNTGPGRVSKITCEAVAADESDEPTIKLSWSKASNAEKYELEYCADDVSYFDTRPEGKVTTKTIELESDSSGVITTLVSSGIEVETNYYFRIRSVNDIGEAPWSETSEIIISGTPAAPTVWSSTTVVGTDGSVRLYWMHNSTDESVETYAYLEVWINDDSVLSTTIAKKKSDAEKGIMSSYEFKMVDENGVSLYPDGGVLKWRVKTAGVSKAYGDPCAWQEVNIYVKPRIVLTVTDANGTTLGGQVCYNVDYIIYDDGTMEFFATDEIVQIETGSVVSDSYTDTGDAVYYGTDDNGEDTYYYLGAKRLGSFPINVAALVDAGTQVPVTYYVSITPKSGYETTDNAGVLYDVVEDQPVYAEHFDTSEALSVSLSAGDMQLSDGVRYEISCLVSMDSGLTAEDGYEFTVDWDDTVYEPDADVEIDTNTLSAFITPKCVTRSAVYYKVARSGSRYTLTDEELDGVYGSLVSNAVVTNEDGEELNVYYGTDGDGNNVYYASMIMVTDHTDFLFSVYRREYDGTFTEIDTNIPGDTHMTVKDPHPALDYARYRIVAKSTINGAVGYYDTPGYEVGEKAIVIQWDEEWSAFDLYGDNRPVMPTGMSGSMIKLPYNIDISNKVDPDVEFIEYIGRAHPVSYYGTQRGETASWNATIDKSDKELIYALRRLSAWPGDVYVREPSGIGYWANVNVSFSMKHKEVAIPVSIEVTRVEGGV